MKAVEFEGQTNILGPPRDWNKERDGLCGALPIRAEIDDRGMPLMSSFWRPSKEDLIMLNNGAHVCLRIVGNSHPPVAVYVESAKELP